jgi:hypothetical protein
MVLRLMWMVGRCAEALSLSITGRWKNKRGLRAGEIDVGLMTDRVTALGLGAAALTLGVNAEAPRPQTPLEILLERIGQVSSLVANSERQVCDRVKQFAGPEIKELAECPGKDAKNSEQSALALATERMLLIEASVARMVQQVKRI